MKKYDYLVYFTSIRSGRTTIIGTYYNQEDAKEAVGRHVELNQHLWKAYNMTNEAARNLYYWGKRETWELVEENDYEL